MKAVHTILIVAGVAGVGLLVWAYAKSKQPGASGGIWGQVGTLWGGASSLTQDVTEKSVHAGETLGGGIKSGAFGIASIAEKFTPGYDTVKGWFS